MLLSLVRASVRPGSAVFGALQTPPAARAGSAYQFAGVYDPGNGIYWHVRRRPFFEGAVQRLRDLADVVRFQDSRPLRDDCSRRFLYRVFILDKLNAIKNAAKRGLVTVHISRDKVYVTRAGFLRKLANNCY
ncbi:MBL fold metallo-hydrolase [Babesia caballi]|uniref:MBL fold metallo-hydrolase n=1 Tax=Babesia caballi TaxID=5871 RepID=A0AAV4LVI5_BABCB|nr:MBL fold metallo-hydrolase [Babesia caballi]